MRWVLGVCYLNKVGCGGCLINMVGVRGVLP